MFERRLKVFLVLLAIVALFVLGRAAQVQIVHRDYWKLQATEAMKLTHLVETTRGPIYDRNGKLLAVDKPCIDACIDYRALTNPPDEDWVKLRALERLKTRLGDQWTKLPGKQRIALRDEEIIVVKDDIEQMWTRLARVSGRSLDDIDQARADVVRRVDMRQRYVWYKRYQEALNKGGRKVETIATWKKLITDGNDDAAPVDNFEVVVAEQLEPHVILPAIDLDVQNQLGKDIDKYPGLILRPGTHRTYPYADVACHLLGHLAHVDAKDLDENKGMDELRAYLRNDLIGKTGIESLCEPALRGTRGKIDRVMGDDTILSSREGIDGQPVRLSVDVELQQQIQAVFSAATLRDSNGTVTEENVVVHGAAVVMDVETNQVLALVSYPTFDLNQLDELYPTLRDDEINDALRNRATMSQLEPGSTFKPFCGLAGIGQGAIGVNEGIECTGILRLDGHPIPWGRCWVESKFGEFLRERGMSAAHHPIPFPHVGHDGNPDGFLTYSDALERSCNIFFETVADRLGIDALSAWYDKFGFGRPTGLGIGEVKGRLPKDFPVHLQVRRRITGFLGGIGQGYVAATPIQMANGAAMIARNGIWMRPVLVLPDTDGVRPAMRAGDWQKIPDRVDLHLPAAALKAAHLGMFNVVNGKAGTGKPLVAGDKMLQDLGICGKTGTAQAARFSIIERDAAGKIIYDENHRPKRRFLDPSIPGKPSPEAPWYRAEVSKTTIETSPGVREEVDKLSLDHSWYIGFAPADHPKIAFAVMIEYGGSGSGAAASVAREAIEACISRGYLEAPPADAPQPQP